jgi:IS5 family transposase
VHRNLAYRWFCRLDLTDRIPDHSTFSKNRHGRFRESELLRHLFETTVARCIAEGLVSGQRMAVDASLIEADANKQNSTPKEEWDASQIDPDDAPRAVREYLDTLDEAAFGAASEVQPKFTSHSDPASQWTAARKGPAFFAYSDNYLIDTDHGVIVGVEATRSIRQAEVGSTRTMLERVKDRFNLHPERLIADTAFGTGPMLGWLVERKIAPHIPVFDKSGRSDGTWTRADFEWDAENNQFICPEGEALKQFRRNYSDPNRGPTGKGVAKYRGLKNTCQACPSKQRCCPNMDFRFITREEHEDARQVAREIAKTPQYDISMKLRKKVEMLFAHLKRILGLGRLRLRGPCGANDEFLLAATAQNLRKLAKIFPAPQKLPST